MGKYTEKLNLYLTDMEKDGNDVFNFDRDLNDNWNKLDNTIGTLSNLQTENKSEIVSAINEVNEIALECKNKTDFVKYCVNSGAVDESGNPAYLVSYTKDVEVPTTDENAEPTTETHTYLKLLANTVYSDKENTYTVASDVILDITDKNVENKNYNIFVEHVNGSDVLTVKKNLVEVAHVGTVPTVSEDETTTTETVTTVDDNYLIIPQEPLQAYWVNTLGTKTPTNAVNIGSYCGGGVTSPSLKGFSDNVFTDRRVNKEIRIVETYDNGGSFYRLYSDGLCIQGGNVSANADKQGTVTLLKTYKDTNYFFTVSILSTYSSADNCGPVWVRSKTVSSFVFLNDCHGGSLYWLTRGYIA